MVFGNLLLRLPNFRCSKNLVGPVKHKLKAVEPDLLKRKSSG